MWAFPMFLLIDTKAVALIFVAILVITAANAIMGGVQPALITGMFPTRLRYSGASICYTVGSILGGGVTPLLATALFAEFGSTVAVSTLVVVVSLISLLAILPAGRHTLLAGEPAPSRTSELPAAPAVLD